MTAPFVPYTQTYASTLTYFDSAAGTRQAQPYDTDTSYTRRRVWTNGRLDARNTSWGLKTGNWPSTSMKDANVFATNKARASFVGRLGDSSSFGATLTAEAKGTFSLVVGTILKMGRAARAIKRLDFPTAARELGLPYIERTVSKRNYVTGRNGRRRYLKRIRYRTFRLPTGREVQKTLANGWLMWSYGVQPLMADVYNGMDLLLRPLPSTRINGFGSSSASYANSGGGGSTWKFSNVWSTQVSVRCAADVSVSNPNLWLANKLGLINPLQWVNEAVPFSFVLDWCSNLSQMIGQCTDFAGLTISKPCTTVLETNSQVQWYEGPPPSYTATAKQVTFWRSLSIPSAKLIFGYERFGWQRGLNAISLLVGFLPRKT